MHAVIMAGGRGTRLQPLTQRLPKPMLQLLDRPMMEYIVELLAMHEIRDLSVTVCYLPETIRNYFGNGSKWGVNIKYVEEPLPLGTAGGVKAACKDIDDTIIVMSGDGLMDYDLSRAILWHRKRRAQATLLLKRVTCPLGYGVVDVKENGEIVQFMEKPKTWTKGKVYYINTGIYILEPEILAHIPANRPFDFGHELFPQLLDMAVPIFGYEAEGYWSDVGTLHQYYQSQIDMISGKLRIPLSIDGMLGVGSASATSTALGAEPLRDALPVT